MSDAQAVPYTPTAGVAAAQGIPGFTFVDASNVTLGSLRPPVTDGTIGWDVDGAGGDEFAVRNSSTLVAYLSGPGGQFAKTYTGTFGGNKIRNVATGFTVDADALPFSGGNSRLTYNANQNLSPLFTTNTSGQFGFRFTSGSDTFYGWASLTIDLAGSGQGFEITEAYYQTTPNTGIAVGAVPVAVPEPAAMALLALGSAGVMAWRSRRRGSAT